MRVHLHATSSTEIPIPPLTAVPYLVTAGGASPFGGCAEQIILRGIGAEQNGPLLELTVGEDESGSDGVLDPEAEGHALDREEPHVPVGRARQLERSLCP